MTVYSKELFTQRTYQHTTSTHDSMFQGIIHITYLSAHHINTWQYIPRKYSGPARAVYIYDRKLGDCPAKKYRIYTASTIDMVLANPTYNTPLQYIYTVYDRIFGDCPAKNTVCTPHIYGSGQPEYIRYSIKCWSLLWDLWDLCVTRQRPLAHCGNSCMLLHIPISTCQTY